jgi:hypothetical protein
MCCHQFLRLAGKTHSEIIKRGGEKFSGCE